VVDHCSTHQTLGTIGISHLRTNINYCSNIGIYTMVHKSATFIFWIAPWTLADFNNFQHATSKRNLTQITSFGHLTPIPLVHYLVKCRSRSLAIYNNEFILDSPRVGSEMINWIVTNRIGNYYILHSLLLQHVLKMFSSSTNASCKRWHHSPEAGSITCILQSSVATALKWGHLCRVSSWL